LAVAVALIYPVDVESIQSKVVHQFNRRAHKILRRNEKKKSKHECEYRVEWHGQLDVVVCHLDTYGSLLGAGSNTCKVGRPGPASDAERHLQMTVGFLQETESLKVAVQVVASLVP